MLQDAINSDISNIELPANFLFCACDLQKETGFLRSFELRHFEHRNLHSQKNLC